MSKQKTAYPSSNQVHESLVHAAHFTGYSGRIQNREKTRKFKKITI